MADNYLERRMEEYRNGPRKMFRRSGCAVKAVFVAEGTTAEGELLVRRLAADPECRVAFSGDDLKAGTRLAQQTGSRFYPLGAMKTQADAIAEARSYFAPLPLEVIHPSE